MMHYAEINNDGICISIKTVKNTINDANHIEIESLDFDLLYKKYENGQWSVEKYLPDAAAIQLSEFEKLKQENDSLKSQIELMQKALDDLLLGGM